jgi:hypothetical protein
MSELESFEFERLRDVIVRMFNARATHDLPASLRAPPRDWAVPYRALAEEVGLDPDPSVGYRLASAFLDPILRAESDLAQWDSEALEWRAS